MSMTLQSPSLTAVYLTVPTSFVHLSSLYEWVNLRRRMSMSTCTKALMLLCRWGLIERRRGGYYKQKISAP